MKNVKNISYLIIMNVPRCLFVSTSLGEIAIVADFYDPIGRILSSAKLYDSTSTWVWKMCLGAFIDRKCYVVGRTGIEKPSMPTSREVYDLEKKKKMDCNTRLVSTAKRRGWDHNICCCWGTTFCYLGNFCM